MNHLNNALNVTPGMRRITVMLAFVIALTSTRVQAAQAQEVLPALPAWATTNTAAIEDTTQSRGIVLPPGVIAASRKNATEATRVVLADAPAPEVQAAPARQVWNTINSADLVTQAPHSSEDAVRTLVVPTTAYTSDPAETDGSPFTTANGTRVRDGIIAANFLKFGTRVRIPQYFGDKVFTVADRMNARYTQRVDIWMTNKTDARQWGVRNVKIEVLP